MLTDNQGWGDKAGTECATLIKFYFFSILSIKHMGQVGSIDVIEQDYYNKVNHQRQIIEMTNFNPLYLLLFQLVLISRQQPS